MMWLLAAGLWGFSEATFFFLVPDILLTFIALRHGWRAGMIASGIAAICAALGGAYLYQRGASDPIGARAFLEAVPALKPWLIDEINKDIAEDWAGNLFVGAVSGKPYKAYAVAAGGAATPLPLFLLVSVFARFTRFALTVSLTAIISGILARTIHLKHRQTTAKTILWVLTWLLVYGIYFTIMGW